MSIRNTQQEFKSKGFERFNDSFGGENLKSHPKSKRPLDSKLPIHLTLKATKSILRTPKTFVTVESTIKDITRKHGVKVYKSANVGNHIHIAIKIPHVCRWAAFIRELTGRLELALRKYTGEQKLWLFRPHTRVVRGWQKAFRIVLDYIQLNQFEAEGIISRTYKKKLRELHALFFGAMNDRDAESSGTFV